MVDFIEVIDIITQNPFFLKYGRIGLFLNGLLSSVVTIPTELTTLALLAVVKARSQFLSL